MNIIIQVFTGILAKLAPNTVKMVIDKGLDVIEDHLTKDGVKGGEQVVLSSIDFLRKQLGITEEEGSPFADKK